MTNEQLMWMSIAVWIAFIALLAYFVFFGKSTVALPSGNVAEGAAAAGGVA